MTPPPGAGKPARAGPAIVPGAGGDRLLTAAEVAAMLRVHPKTVTRWAQQDKLWHTRTPGGQRRYSEIEVRSLCAGWGRSSGDAPGGGSGAPVAP